MKALKGNIIFTQTPQEFTVLPHGYLVYEEDKVVGAFAELPTEYAKCEVKDYGDKLIIPGLVDLHVHAPQYAFRGIGMDRQLLDWLNTYTFPAEARFSDTEYAREVYEGFARELNRCGTTRAVVFGTIHLPATYILMEELEKYGIHGYVGKVNMDRNAPEFLTETHENSIKDTETFISYTQENFKKLKPIITPRFVPSCTDKTMQALGELAQKYNLPVQSHLSENLSEVAWVKELQPESENYCHAYERFGLFNGENAGCIMAHCVHISEEEMQKMQKNSVTVAHCPDSNMNLTSGISPIRSFLEHGVQVGLGTDIAGGFRISIFQVMAEACQVSKLNWIFGSEKDLPLSISEAFYLGTSGGAAFFGDKPGFAQGNAMHALVIDDSSLGIVRDKTLKERIERVIHVSDDRNIIARYASGEKIDKD